MPHSFPSSPRPSSQQKGGRHSDRPGSGVPALYAAALQCHRSGQLAKAEQHCRNILVQEGRHFESLHLLGVLAFQAGRHEAAVELVVRAIAIHPEEALYHCNLGIVVQTQGKLREAVEHYERALALQPGYAEAYFNQGSALQALGRLDEAAGRYVEALAVRPDYAVACMNLGNVLQSLGRCDEALDRYEEALRLRPDYAEAHMNLGNVLQSMDRPDEAMQHYLAALVLSPDSADVHVNLGNLLQGQGQLDEAVVAYERALALHPEHVGALLNLGTALGAQGRPEEAVARYDQALALRPDCAEAHMNKALQQLRRGDYSAGWRGFEWRSRLPTFRSPRRNFIQPQWRGEALLGKRILLHGEQGLGDCLQFLRYVPMVQAAGGAVVLEAPASLRRLAAEVPGLVELRAFGEPLPQFDWHCPLMSLPLAFSTTVNTIPAHGPYLSTPQQARDKALALAWPDDGLRVGVVWAGNAEHPNDRRRSMPLSLLAPVLAVRGIHFFSLQVGKTAVRLPDGLIDLAPAIADMADTAALIGELDLVISVDTAVAHLTGALARPLWLLLARDADWRWLTAREDSPWYPSARLFRQDGAGWEGVVERVGAALVEWRDCFEARRGHSRVPHPARLGCSEERTLRR